MAPVEIPNRSDIWSTQQLLLQSQMAYRAGLNIAAGSLARVCLERHLSLLCKTHGVFPPKRQRRNGLTIWSAYVILHKNGFFDASVRSDIRAIKRMADPVVHGRDPGWVKIAQLIEAVEGFVARFPVTEVSHDEK